ncbi:hypothetical protein KC19_VG173000 [Ceratodon purpureus]|uniref:Uncharacterized protein n=1 Tax=Ceratodon purpureus TaxID=3225 RepID=A0A8T0HRM1_CERPU|nr:hypothetical protein KC19_VG173000 [Ceratodon purpureus]
MSEAFEITQDLPEVYVGLNITRNRSARSLTIDQTRYVLQKLKEFGFQDCHPVSVPADPNTRLDLFSCDADDLARGALFPYKAMVGSLLFASLAPASTSPTPPAPVRNTTTATANHIATP